MHSIEDATGSPNLLDEDRRNKRFIVQNSKLSANTHN